MSISQTLNRAGTQQALDQVLGGTALTRIAFVASSAPQAQEGLDRLSIRYGNLPVQEAQVVVALGGDGFMLETMHSVLGRAIPVYGMNCGSVGFLMNSFIEGSPAGTTGRCAGRGSASAAHAFGHPDRCGRGGARAQRGEPASPAASDGEDPGLRGWAAFAFLS